MAECVDAETAREETRRVSGLGKGAFTLSNMGTAFSWGFITSYFMLFCTDALGISAYVCSLLLLGSRLFDGVTDVLCGVLLDRHETRWGRYRPWIAVFAIPVALTTCLLFYCDASWPLAVRIAWVTVAYLLYLLAFTGLNTSLCAMSSVMSGSPDERASIISLQRAAGILGVLVMTAIAAAYFESNGSSNASSYFELAVLFGAISIPLYLLTPLFCKERIIPEKPQKPQYRASKVFRDNLSNEPFRIALMGHFLNGFVIYGRVSIFVYYFKYVVGSMAMYALFILVMRVAQIVGAWAAQHLLKLFKMPGRALVVVYVTYGLCLVATFFVAPSGSALMLWWVLVALASLLFGASNAMIYIIIPDLVDFCEYRNKTRNDGGVFTILEFGNKVGMALGTAGIGIALGMLGYSANMAQTPEVITGINVWMFIVPGVLSALIGLLFVRYKLTRTVLHAND